MAVPAHSTPASRRLFLASGSAAAVFGALSAAAAQSVKRSELPDLIEAHKAAYARLDHAVGARNDIEDALDEERHKNPVLVPVAVMPNGECHSGRYELGPISSDVIREKVKETHDSLRRIHCSKWSRVMFPELAVAAERELDASQARALQALADAEAVIEAQERDAGLSAAEGVVGVAEEEEFEARLSLAVYAPRNAAEAAMKRAYIEQSPPFRDGWCGDGNEFVEAMIERIGEQNARPSSVS